MTPARRQDLRTPETLDVTSPSGEPRVGEPARLSLGQVLAGRFVIRELVGTGGMGEVYKVFDLVVPRQLALKRIRDSRGARRERLERGLLTEAAALARINHPNVVSLKDIGCDGDDLFITMDLVDGRSLWDWQRTGPSLDELISAYLAAGRGLEAVHRSGVVHRDFKPGNIVRSHDGTVRLIDFNVAGIERGGFDDPAHGFPGTFRYRAPELGEGRRSSPRSDQYSYCFAFREALAQRSRPLAWGRAPRIKRVLQRGLAADPSRRYPDMTSLLAQLERELGRTARAARTAIVTLVALVGVAGGWAACERIEQPKHRFHPASNSCVDASAPHQGP